MKDLQKAVAYLESFEEVDVISVDTYGDRIVLGPVPYDFLIIAGAYVESNWGVRVALSGQPTG